MVEARSSQESDIRDPELDRIRSVAQLNMLHSLAAKLNALGDVQEIGEAITAELRTIIDYHNCRVYLLQPDAETLMPIAFRGDLSTDYEKETLENLVTWVGRGMTGHVAATGESLLTPDARDVDFALTIEGTDDILESMLVVPMLVGDEVVGVIVLSSRATGSSTPRTSGCSRCSPPTPRSRSRTQSCSRPSARRRKRRRRCFRCLRR